MPGAKPSDKGADLLGMESVPEGFEFRREAAWQRLEAQLKRPRRRRFLPYAAAVILLLLGLGAWIMLDRRPVANRASAESKPPSSNSVVTRPKTPVLKRAEHAEAPLPQARDVAAPVPKAIARPIPLPGDTAPPARALVAPPLVIQPSPDTLQPSSPPAKALTAQAGKKPRFPVAHINELNSPEPTASAPETRKPATAFIFKPRQTVEYVSGIDEAPPPRNKRRFPLAPISSSQ